MLYLNKVFAVITLAAGCLLLNACSSPAHVPVEDHSILPSKKTVYIAGSGDTLYSIAFLAGLDYRQVAAWNNISEPYTIRRGQRIALIAPQDVQNPVTQPVVSRPLKTTAASAANQAPVSKPAKTASPAPAPATGQLAVFDNTWRWPVSKSDLVGYKRSGQNNGLDITSSQGAPVTASAAGKVVYAGDSLKGYGNLVIIKHSDTYLSAYAHNRSLSVTEGEHIRQGQKIAEVGNSGASPGVLHFEIRKNGTAVNPLGLLPRKVG